VSMQGYVPPTAVSPKDSKANVGVTPKGDAKTANSPDLLKITERAKPYPTQATGADPSKPIVAPSEVSADYYRYGKFSATEKGYEIQPKAFEPFDETVPSSIRIWGKGKAGSGGKAIFSDIIPAYTKFFLESVQESHSERSQIIETFGDFYVFMFGERPSVYNFSGQLLNSKKSNWVTDFMFMYDRYLRGTRCVEQNATAIVTYGGRQVEGLILSASTMTNAAVEGSVAFNFSLVVFKRSFYNFSADMGYSTADFKNLTVDTKFRSLLEKIAGTEGEGSSDPQTSKAIAAAKKTAKGDLGSSTVKSTNKG